MSDQTTTLYKGDVKRRVGTARERRQLLAAGWSEKAPKKAAPKPESKPADKPQSKSK